MQNKWRPLAQQAVTFFIIHQRRCGKMKACCGVCGIPISASCKTDFTFEALDLIHHSGFWVSLSRLAMCFCFSGFICKSLWGDEWAVVSDVTFLWKPNWRLRCFSQRNRWKWVIKSLYSLFIWPNNYHSSSIINLFVCWLVLFFFFFIYPNLAEGVIRRDHNDNLIISLIRVWID